MAAKRTRMSASERREQLIAVARGLFAERGFDATSVEEVAARAQVSKPVVYEHFGGKEGLYAVVVDREITTISAAISSAIADPASDAATAPEAGRRATEGPDASGSASRVAERAALALLTYIEDSPDGFRILSAGSDRAAGAHSPVLAGAWDAIVTPSGSCTAPIIANLSVNPVFAALAACGGSLFYSYFNDSFFWVVNRSIGITEGKEQLRLYSVASTIAWATGIVVLLILNAMFG